MGIFLSLVHSRQAHSHGSSSTILSCRARRLWGGGGASVRAVAAAPLRSGGPDRAVKAPAGHSTAQLDIIGAQAVPGRPPRCAFLQHRPAGMEPGAPEVCSLMQDVLPCLNARKKTARISVFLDVSVQARVTQCHPGMTCSWGAARR